MRNRRVKVLHTITRLIVGGASENTMLTAQLLNKEKFRIDVVSGPETGSSGSLFNECKSRKVNVKIFPYLVREINPFKDFIHLLKMISFLKSKNYDIIHTHSSKAGILHRLAAKIAGIPIIIHTIHGWSFNDEMPAWKKNLYICLEKFTAKFTSKLVAVTELDIRKGLNEGIGEKYQYVKIHSAIEINRYEKPDKPLADIRTDIGIGSSKLIIGTVSRMDEQKAPMDFMKVAKIICNENEQIQFLFIGGGPLENEIKAYIAENNLENRIITPGIRYDVPNMLAMMDIFILTSLWEGLPRVFSQAMAAKVPIVATKVDGAPEIISDGVNGFLVEPRDINSMCEKIKILINDDETRNRFIENGYQRIFPDFDVYHMVKQLEELYLNEKRDLV